MKQQRRYPPLPLLLLLLLLLLPPPPPLPAPLPPPLHRIHTNLPVEHQLPQQVIRRP